MLILYFGYAFFGGVVTAEEKYVWVISIPDTTLKHPATKANNTNFNSVEFFSISSL